MTKSQAVSLSGGKDSLAMTLMMLERGEQVDAIVYVDVGWDFPEVQREIDRLEKRTGKPLIRLLLKHSFMYWMTECVVLDKDTKKLKRIGYGWPSWNRRWCTREKVTAIDKYVLGAFGAETTQCIGFAAGEEHRCESKAQKKKNVRYPLIEWGITEKNALDYCLERGYRWDGLYEIFDRLSCFCCPLQGVGDLRNLRQHRPQLYARLLEMDAQIPLPKRRFDHEATVDDLERRFVAENKQKCLNLKSK